MSVTIDELLQADPALSGLAGNNIGWAAEGCPAIALSYFDGVPAFPIPGHDPLFVRVSCVAPSFVLGMSMARQVRAALADLPGAFQVGGQSDAAGRVHTISTDYEVWTPSE